MSESAFLTLVLGIAGTLILILLSIISFFAIRTFDSFEALKKKITEFQLEINSDVKKIPRIESDLDCLIKDYNENKLKQQRLIDRILLRVNIKEDLIDELQN